MGGQNDKVHLKNTKLFRIIPKKRISLIFFKNFGGALVLLNIRHCIFTNLDSLEFMSKVGTLIKISRAL